MNTTGHKHDIQKKLKCLFDYQCFANNQQMASLITDSESRYHSTLDDEDLDFVSAAGDIDLSEIETPFRKGKNKDE